MIKNILLSFFLLGTVITANAQSAAVWNNKQCAVVLTYDDAIAVDLDHVVPALDSLKLKGTFYLIGSSPVITSGTRLWTVSTLAASVPVSVSVVAVPSCRSRLRDRM